MDRPGHPRELRERASRRTVPVDAARPSLGAIAGIAGLGLGLETLGCLLVGAVGLLLGVTVFAILGWRMIRAHIAQIQVRFPTPGTAGD